MATRLSDEQLADFARDMRRMLDALPPPKPREKPTRQRLEGSWLATCLIAGADPSPIHRTLPAMTTPWLRPSPCFSDRKCREPLGHTRGAWGWHPPLLHVCGTHPQICLPQSGNPITLPDSDKEVALTQARLLVTCGRMSQRETDLSFW